MTTRDPHSRDTPALGTPAGEGGHEPTQSLNLAPGEQPSPALLALGTHNRHVTPIESPHGRGKTPAPPGAQRAPAMPGRHPDEPEEYLDAVLGSYRVVELLGKGGMGYVFRAEHTKLGREVALKLLRSDYAIRRDAVARFFQEARTVNRVRHRNIVEVTDFVELDDGTTYIIMELLTGTSLGTWARTGIDLPRALAVLVQICDGLGAAHQVGVVHRDLKPDNVIVVPTSDGADLVKLLDFGVAKLLNREDEDVGFETAAGAVIGTPAYMSPEQAGGMVIDARSDIYSLGAIMYELFCGQPMFRGRSFGEYVRKHLTEIPVPPRQTPGGAGIAPELEAVIQKSLEKDPAQRFSRIIELREALLALLGSTGMYMPGITNLTGSGMRSQVTQLPLMPQLMHAPTPSSQLSQRSGAQLALSHPSAPYSSTPLPAPARTTPWWVWFAGGALAVGLGITTAVWYAGRGDPNLPAQAPASTATQTAAQPNTQPTAQPPAQPTAQPIDPPPARAQLVEVRFDSLPSGGVFADGHAAELCRTPCAFNIDLSDGGPADHREFVVRRDGYTDGVITVDLTGEKREFRVLLQQAAPTAQSPGEHTEQPPDTRGNGKPDARPDKRLTKRPGKWKKDGKDAKDAKNGKDSKDTKDGVTGHDSQDTPDAHVPDHPADPAETKPVTPKKTPGKPTIDPSDTLDPFRSKQ